METKNLLIHHWTEAMEEACRRSDEQTAMLLIADRANEEADSFMYPIRRWSEIGFFVGVALAGKVLWSTLGYLSGWMFVTAWVGSLVVLTAISVVVAGKSLVILRESTYKRVASELLACYEQLCAHLAPRDLKKNRSERSIEESGHPCDRG